VGVQWIPDEQRALYHAGVVHGANHLVTLLVQAFDVLRSAGVADPPATMRPLLMATLGNTLDAGADALTGPVARGDAATVAAHLGALPAGRTVRTYVELAAATVEQAERSGRIDAATGRRLATLLTPAQGRAESCRVESCRRSCVGWKRVGGKCVGRNCVGRNTGGTTVRLTQTKAELRAATAVRPRAVVMTMGALHDGHAALLAEARERVGPGGSVV
jgi:hypothetical protein